MEQDRFISSSFLCVVLLRVSSRMFHKQGISGQHHTVRIIDTATLMEAFVVLLRDRDVLKDVYWTLFVAARIQNRKN